MAELFPFVQFEFPFVLGPADGRYLARGEGGEEVLVLHTTGAPRRRLLGGRRARPAGEGPTTEPVPVTRATVVRAQALEDETAAQRWLARVSSEAESRERAVRDALALLNRALHVHRAATADPLVGEVASRQATVTRLGYGHGDRLAEGRWSEAVTLPQRPPRRRRVEHLQPQERLAAVLGGRDEVAVCETLLLRARLDLDGGRQREAALQIRVALEALLAELGDQSRRPDQAADLAFLGAQRETIGTAANAALTGEPDQPAIVAVRETIERCERVLRRKRVLSG